MGGTPQGKLWMDDAGTEMDGLLNIINGSRTHVGGSAGKDERPAGG